MIVISGTSHPDNGHFSEVMKQRLSCKALKKNARKGSGRDLWTTPPVRNGSICGSGKTFLFFFVFLFFYFCFLFLFLFFFSLMAAVPVGMGNRFLLPHSTSILRVQSLRHWLVSAQRTLSPQGCVLRGCHIPPRSSLMVFGVRCSHFFVEDLSPDTGPQERP